MQGSLHEWIDRFLKERQAQGLAHTTLYADRLALRRLRDWMIERDLSIQDLTPARVAPYVDRMYHRRVEGGSDRQRQIAVATLQVELRAVRLWFRYLVSQGALLFDPVRGVRIKCERRLCGRGVFSVREVRRLFAQMKGNSPLFQRDRALFGLMYGTGLRVGEVVSLDLADYDPNDGQVWVRRGKGNKGRVVPVGSVTRRDLAVYLKQGRSRLVGRAATAALFVSLKRRRLALVSITSRLVQLQQRAGIAPVRRCHALRHAFATHMLARGADVRVLQEFLGHDSADTTLRYTHVEIRDLRRALSRAHPRERTPR